MTSVESALRQAVADLNALKARWALIGGLAVSPRTIPRFTKNLDFAVAVADDGEAEGVVHRLQSRGYAPVEILEQDLDPGGVSRAADDAAGAADGVLAGLRGAGGVSVTPVR